MPLAVLRQWWTPITLIIIDPAEGGSTGSRKAQPLWRTVWPAETTRPCQEGRVVYMGRLSLIAALVLTLGCGALAATWQVSYGYYTGQSIATGLWPRPNGTRKKGSIFWTLQSGSRGRRERKCKSACLDRSDRAAGWLDANRKWAPSLGKQRSLSFHRSPSSWDLVGRGPPRGPADKSQPLIPPNGD